MERNKQISFKPVGSRARSARKLASPVGHFWLAGVGYFSQAPKFCGVSRRKSNPARLSRCSPPAG
jgi:hypothetical protein